MFVGPDMRVLKTLGVLRSRHSCVKDATCGPGVPLLNTLLVVCAYLWYVRTCVKDAARLVFPAYAR